MRFPAYLFRRGLLTVTCRFRAQGKSIPPDRSTTTAKSSPEIDSSYPCVSQPGFAVVEIFRRPFTAKVRWACSEGWESTVTILPL